MKRPLKTIPFTQQPLFIFRTLAALDVFSVEIGSKKKIYVYIYINIQHYYCIRSFVGIYILHHGIVRTRLQICIFTKTLDNFKNIYE